MDKRAPAVMTLATLWLGCGPTPGATLAPTQSEETPTSGEAGPTPTVPPEASPSGSPVETSTEARTPSLTHAATPDGTSTPVLPTPTAVLLTPTAVTSSPTPPMTPSETLGDSPSPTASPSPTSPPPCAGRDRWPRALPLCGGADGPVCAEPPQGIPAIGETAFPSLSDVFLAGEKRENAFPPIFVGDITGDGIGDLAILSPDWEGGGDGAGIIYILQGPVEGTLGPEDVIATIESQVGVSSIARRLSAGDVNGDGVGDLIVGGSVQGEPSIDAAFIHLGPFLGPRRLEDTPLWIQHEGLLALPPRLGDVNGDGLDDIVFAGYSVLDAGDAPMVHLYLAPFSAPVGPEAPHTKILPIADDDWIGSGALLMGDLDGDCRADLIIGAPGRDRYAPGSGSLYVVSNPPPGLMSLWDADVTLSGTELGAYLGDAAALPGDITGDGVEDLAVQVLAHSEAGEYEGAVLIFAGPFRSGERLDSEADGTILGRPDGGQIGQWMAGGDGDGDGVGELLLGTNQSNEGGHGSGIAEWITGPILGTHGLAAVRVGWFLGGEEDRVLPVDMGDLNGDGRAELIIGAIEEDGREESVGGAAVVYISGGPADKTRAEKRQSSK